MESNKNIIDRSEFDIETIFEDEEFENQEIRWMKNRSDDIQESMIFSNATASKELIASESIRNQIKYLIDAYKQRGESVQKLLIEKTQNENDESGDDDDDEEEEDYGQQSSDRFRTSENLIKKFCEEWRTEIVRRTEKQSSKKLFDWNRFTKQVYEPQSTAYIFWLMIVSIGFLYDATMIPFRLTFPQYPLGINLFWWLDIVVDFIYLLDIVWFKPRLMFLEQGEWIDSVSRTNRHYFRSKKFLLDLIGQIPLDWLTMYSSPNNSLLFRLNRLTKYRNMRDFFDRIDKATNKPYLFRIIHTVMYELYIIHLEACLYYCVSKWIGFGTTAWTFDNQGNAYIRCFYFAFRTTNSIGGRLQKPTNDLERVYMLIAWLLGVFVFAMVIGQIRDIAANATHDLDYYIDLLNKIGNYMNRLSVPNQVQERVRFWFKFTWDLQKTFNEIEIIEMLPLKMRTDLMMMIHSKTLSQVELFRDIERSVLRDLILKLQPILFLPGDFVFHKGNVGHEMYIINKGMINVIDSNQKKILATLSEGSVFGELAILDLRGHSRRTADAKSLGYSQIFVLKKQDLWETLRYYPEYRKVLKRKVRKIFESKQKNEKFSSRIDEANCRSDSITILIHGDEQKELVRNILASKSNSTTPRLYQIAMTLISRDSKFRKYFRQNSNKTSNEDCHQIV
ncbi:hypothetical protein NH340_JMT02404 [Sarcoptes scabiei]|nr:hypothetical protein NH340_JMT02404 [Sarcoptes scabiei]